MGCCIKDLLKHLEPREKNRKRRDYIEENNNQIDYRGSEILKLKNNRDLNKNEKLLSEREKKLKDGENNLQKNKTLFEKEKKEYEEQKEKDKILLEEKLKSFEDLKQEKEKILLENDTLVKYKSENEEKDKDILNKANTIKEKDSQIEKLKKELEEKDKELMEIKNIIENKDNEINNNIAEKNLIENKDSEINNNIAEKNLELIKREETLNLFEKKLKDWENNLKVEQDPILIGLNNIGATCYMNASLQCLSNTKKLTQYFLKTYKYTSDKIMANEYYKVIKNLWKKENNNKTYSPNSFKEVLSKENPLFAGIAANDSKDLINFLLERFHKELNSINIENNINNNSKINMLDQTNEQLMLKLFLNEFQEKYNSPISNLFYGIIETKSQCQLCNIIKYNFQIYSFIEFPLQQVNNYFFNKGKRPLITIDGKNPDIDLYECFEYNQKVDLMQGDNQMFCNNCNKLCNSFYSTFLYSGPYYLIINLNRGKGAVYECKVCFPELLNIFNFLTYKDGVTVYELYAVICHLGPSSMSGHFVAYCRNRIDNKWYLYNDSIVTLCSRKNQYNEGMPYILFYKALMPGQDSEY